MKKLRIGQIGPLNLPIPPKKYGGTEKIIYSLCEGLTKKGHEVFLFAAKDSKTSAHLCPIVEKSLWTLKIKPQEYAPYYAYQMAIVAQKAKKLKLDIIHDHLGPWSLALYGQTKIPIVHTLHVPFRKKDRIWAYRKLNSKLISISFAQRKPAPDLNYVANIYNGIDLSLYPFNPKPKDYFIWVGELSPRKGIMEVIEIAKLAKLKLIIIGRIPPPVQKIDYDFFNQYIKKNLNKGNAKYLGELNQEKIGKYYKEAKAFLYPLQWEEPFGLTMTESMACGTPVIAFKRGSVPEVIKDNKTGLIVSPLEKNGKINLKGFIQAIKKIGQIDRKECRDLVKENFSEEMMIDNYEKTFLKILDQRSSR
ncbi:MAG: glycosyltransferase family 4 protein [Candidatus Nealsonbacteria bacterium]|nr:glycosyltransferase family 4 protein [Candidatus Nealsonbacteria bacterium]